MSPAWPRSLRCPCLLAGNFLPRGRRSDPESPAMSWCCRHYNPPVAGRSGRGTGNLTGPEQGVIRQFRSGSGKEQAAENGSQDRAPPGCNARPGLPATGSVARVGVGNGVQFANREFGGGAGHRGWRLAATPVTPTSPNANCQVKPEYPVSVGQLVKATVFSTLSAAEI